MTLTVAQNTKTQIDAREVAYLIAVRLSHAGYIEDNDIYRGLSGEDLPSVQCLIGGRRFLINVEEVPENFQPAEQGVLF